MCCEEDFSLPLDERVRRWEALRKPLPPEFIGTAQECYDEAMRRSLAGQPHTLCEVVGPDDPRRTLAAKGDTRG